MAARFDELRRACSVLASLWLVFAAWSSQVAAQDDTRTARVFTQIDPCVPIDAAHFRRVLAIELGTSIEYSSEAGQQGNLTAVRLSCTAAGIQLRLDDALTRKSMTRVVDLAKVDAASRSRLMALAVAEFVVASWVELRMTAPGAIEPVGPRAPSAAQQAVSRVVQKRMPASPSEPAVSPPVSSDWQLGATFQLLEFWSVPQPIAGAALRLTQITAGHWVFGAGLHWAHGSVNTSLPNGTSIGGARLTAASGALNVLYFASVGDVDLSAGIGARFGFVNLAGSSTTNRARAFYAPWGGPLLLLAVGYRIGPRLRLVAELEAGVVTQGVEAQLREDTVLAIKGPWGSAGLGFAWLL